ncbi:MAG: hypothetical protein DCC43_05690 [Candidatus Brocadia sp.]|jgi:hypothetical protein|uniref:Uncharacterized protein n=1 Tax=Candidatus Brocadia fulgida TaxID=380242 RepID=A0A0M2UX21_9BACT|nr:MAG: hypothetical protein BROFUL_01175 [Candidatus Brocadia fulgida]MCC6325722.1 hypothetical protein [Candidatus Brocadia sp.]MCE7911428.1 hypothetical protein [Candidatus Brocadia sp. AMX3]OQY99011.1 MAG: hypothetical protein B6D35_10465 [Candidatus Brocadia sp. UTAMX2]MBV6519847.1 hypothetical protein [Candidatus Brocadia fulgida]
MLRYAASCLILIAVFLPVALAADTKNVPKAIAWEKSLDDAVAKAKAEHKGILLDFFVPT